MTFFDDNPPEMPQMTSQSNSPDTALNTTLLEADDCSPKREHRSIPSLTLLNPQALALARLCPAPSPILIGR